MEKKGIVTGAIVGLALVLGFIVRELALPGVQFWQVYKPMWINNTFDKFQSVNALIEICKKERGDTYPLQETAVPITSANGVSAYVGSTSTDIANWTYQCTSAGTLTLVIDAPSYVPIGALNILKGRILELTTPSPNSVTASSSPKTLTVIRTPVVCK